MEKLTNIFNKEKNIIIGSLHFAPLLGSDDAPKLENNLNMALRDLSAYENGGVDGLFLENNYGGTGEKIPGMKVASMGYLVGEIKKRTKLPLGVSVLWNDYETALAIAKVYDLQFIRVPVFVDVVETYCGVIEGNSKHVREVRNKLDAENVALFTDILVKHSKHISTHSLETAAKIAISEGSDAVIVTGSWTGEPPTAETVQKLRSEIADFPILVGSGTDKENVQGLFAAGANGVIVSTSLKEGGVKEGERNVKGFEQRVQEEKVREFVRSIH